MSSVGSFGYNGGGGGSGAPGSGIKTISEVLALTVGASSFSSAADLLPAKSFIMGVKAEVITALGAETWELGVAGDLTRFAAAGRAAAAGTTTDSLDTVSSGLAFPQSPYANDAAAKAVLTTSTPMAAAASVKVSVYYYALP